MTSFFRTACGIAGLTGMFILLTSSTVRAQKAPKTKAPAKQPSKKETAGNQLPSPKEAAENLKKNPDDAKAYIAFLNAYLGRVVRISAENPAKAEKLLKEMEAVLKEVKPQKDAGKRFLAVAQRYLNSYKQRLENEKKRAQLIGKNAFPLAEGDWVNGSPLSDNDLKGKVVLLDFWAVWCGPCVRTFPHLREWQTKWGEKGLTIIGVTRYYNLKWNEETKHYQRPKPGEKVTPEVEQQMLRKFAAHHNLKHRFLVTPRTSTFQQKYLVSGIPQVVVIDQKGVIRLIRVGAGPANAEAIEKLLTRLLGAGKSSTPKKSASE